MFSFRSKQQIKEMQIVNEKAVSLEEIANSDTVDNQADDRRDRV